MKAALALLLLVASSTSCCAESKYTVVARAQELAPLNLPAGHGDFYMKPNGVFLVTSTGPRIVESSKYSAKPGEVLLATQSGPLLVEHGAIHPRLYSAELGRSDSTVDLGPIIGLVD
jgi:uncharacterized protein YigE (DUF2233 family)